MVQINYSGFCCKNCHYNEHSLNCNFEIQSVGLITLGSKQCWILRTNTKSFMNIHYMFLVVNVQTSPFFNINLAFAGLFYFHSTA